MASEENKTIGKVVEELDEMSADENERLEAYKRKLAIIDYNTSIDMAHKEGKQEGRKEGEKIGREAGEKAGRKAEQLKIAKRLKDGQSVIIGWADEKYTHLDILFTYNIYKEYNNYLQRGLRGNELFVSIISLGAFGFDVDKDVDVKSINGYVSYKLAPNGMSTNEIAYYNLSQPISIKSDDVNKIKDVSLDIVSLMDKGIDIEVRNTSYSYSKLSDLKVKLLESATTDAKQRAAAMLKSTHNSVGHIQSVRMGVFQITPVDSTDVSDMGINDTSTIEKKITAVSNVTFRIK